MSNNPLLFWVLVSAVLLAVVARFYGRKGVSAVLVLAGALLAKDAARHFWGKTAEWIVVGLFAIVCICVYVIKRRKRDQDARRKHHQESVGEHVF